MSLGVSSRLKYPKKQELVKSVSQTTILANKLRQDGQLSTVENVMHAVEQVSSLLSSGVSASVTDHISNMCQHLKAYGAYLELLFQDQLNRAFIVFRNSSQDDEKLDYASRLRLLELIELRANQWKGTDFMQQYYKKKGSHEVTEVASSINEQANEQQLLGPTSPPLLAPGEIIKPSGKFSKPTRIPGKNYCKDEVVIRNADSGKVMGIKGRRVHMIEELSETIISFQRVNPGAKERLVQITGSNEESINHAKQLIEDTIRRNASPIRESGISGAPLTGSSSSLNSSASEESSPVTGNPRNLIHSLSTGDASLGEYKYTVVVGGHTIKITGDNLDLVRMSKLILDEYFSGEPLGDVNNFYSLDSVNEIVLSPPESVGFPSPVQTPNSNDNNNQEEPVPTLRRPKLSVEQILQGKTSPEPEKVQYQRYTLEFLARASLSPFCLSVPDDWNRISNDFPLIARKSVQVFNPKDYLAHRKAVYMENILSAEDAESALEAA